MKVLVIPEDQHLDQFILKPVLEKLFEEIGRKARINILPEPRLRGADQALDGKLLEGIIAANEAMTDLFLLVVDRDCNRNKHEQRVAQRVQEHAGRLLGCLAVEEVECWLLALFEADEIGADWRAVRAHCDPKEEYADPLLERLGSHGPGAGRKAAMRRLPGNWRRLVDRCPELQALAAEIDRFCATAG